MIPQHHLADGRVCVFRPLTGRDEADLALFTGSAEEGAIWLAERLLDGAATTAPPLRDLTLSEFDDLLHHLLTALVGETTHCRATCTACRSGFEFHLDLARVRTMLREAASAVPVIDGVATDPESGRRFRLPSVADMTTLREEGPETWMRSLLVEGEYSLEMEAEIARATPVLAQDFDAPCPECGAANTVRFDISGYLMRALRRDAGFLWREVHLLARTYGWPLDQILGLPRNVRRELAGLVVSDSTRLRVAS